MAALGDYCINCEIQLAGPEYEGLQGCSPLAPAIADQLFSYELSDVEAFLQALIPDLRARKTTTITVDNLLSPVHTLLHIECVDQKGLFYDILRTSKDYNIRVLSNIPPKFTVLLQ